MNEQELVEQARILFKDIQAIDDPSVLEGLHARYNTLADELSALRIPRRDTFSLLPVELKSKIFEDFVASTHNGPFLLSRVCKQWRTLVYQDASLWINVSINTSERNWLENLQIFSRQSADRLLDVTVYFPLTSGKTEEIAALQNLHRWRSLVVLKASSISGPWNFPLRLSQPTALLYLLKSNPFPNLERIDVRVPPVNPRTPFLWSSLLVDHVLPKHVTDPARGLLLSHLTVNLYFTGFEEVIAVLSNQPGLQYLKLTAQRQPTTQPSQLNNHGIVPMPHLRELRMDTDGSDILLALDCPKIEVLTASIFVRELPKTHAKLCAFTNLKMLTLSVQAPYIESELPLAAPQIPLTLTHLKFNYLCPASPEASHELVYGLLGLFSLTTNVTLACDQGTFDWPRAIHLFHKVEHLIIDRTRKESESEDIYRPSTSSSPPPQASELSFLKSLRIETKACTRILDTISAPQLKRLILTETKDLSIDSFLAFIARSPVLYSMRFESVQKSEQDATMLIRGHAMSATPLGSSSIQDIQTTHNNVPILNCLSLSNLQTLRLAGVMQGVSVQRSDSYFDQREIHLLALFDLAPSVLENLTTLDLCVANVLFPTAVGLVDIIPRLTALECISLPRALHKTGVMVDVLFQKMREGSDGKHICARLKDVRTEDYPEWDGLYALLAERNRIAHVRTEERMHSPVPLECLSLPTRPHPSLLGRIQLAMAGKFLPQTDSMQSAQGTMATGCDDCMLTGWSCDTAPDSKVRSSCARHRLGLVRITAYS